MALAVGNLFGGRIHRVMAGLVPVAAANGCVVVRILRGWRFSTPWAATEIGSGRQERGPAIAVARRRRTFS